MSYNHVSAVSIIVLILFAGGGPVSTGQTTNVGLSVAGNLCCTLTGNCGNILPSPGIPGVTVSLNCTIRDGVTRTPVILGTSVTGANGEFNITVAGVNASGVALNGAIIPCILTAPLPINITVCNSLLARTTGSLLSLVLPISLTTTVNTTAFDLVRLARPLLFVRVPTILQLF